MQNSGTCHCGFVQFEVSTDIDHVRVCDFSICHQRGALIFRVPDDALRLKTSLSQLSLYEWGSRTAKDYFCPRCGILPFRRPSAPTPQELAQGVKPFDGWAINARCLHGFDPSGVPVRKVHGRKISHT
ncbi:GFA family protein [Shimia sp.]|uniref:GFA family protein n=1 Tax=Shimia sp. TaxID=1954381 RepID=UPI00329A3F32